MSPGKKKKKARQYFIDLQRWRSLVALIACCDTFFFTVAAIVSSLIHYSRMGWTIRDYFRYFTTLSNLLTALAAVFIIPFAVNGLRKKRFVYPKWLFLLHYMGTIYTTITFVFAMVFILPWDPEFVFGGVQLYLHVVCPIAILIAFELVEGSTLITREYSMKCLIPFFIYSLVYVVMVVVIGEEHGGWEDLYMLNTYVPFYISLPAIWLFSYVIASLIRILANRLNERRRNRMLAHWKEDMEPVEINIEVYGLGRYMGTQDTISELSVPYDILQMIGERYSMDPAALMNVYMKGLLDAVKEKT